MMTRLLLTSLILSCLCPTFARDPSSEGPERWTSAIAAFAERDRATPPKPGSVLFVGSSSIRMWDLQASWPDVPTVNNGFGGSTLADSIHWFDPLFTPYQPGAIVLYAGDNDVAKGLNAREVAEDFTTLATRISATFPGVPVLYLAIKPSQARWNMWPTMDEANRLIAAECAGQDSWHFVDIATPMLDKKDEAPKAAWFAEDGLHLSDRGYERWAGILNQHLRKALTN